MNVLYVIENLVNQKALLEQLTKSLINKKDLPILNQHDSIYRIVNHFFVQIAIDILWMLYRFSIRCISHFGLLILSVREW